MSLEAHRVSLRLGGRPVLRSVSLTLAPGELLAVLGPNGAGKSSLLQVMAGSMAPDAGCVALDGQRLPGIAGGELARRRAVLPQTAALAFSFSVLDVVLLGRCPHRGRSTRADDLAAAEGALAATDTLGLAGRDFTTLSGGERQRVQLARALAQVWRKAADGPPRYLLLDEPTNSLDLAHQHACLRIARRLAEAGAGVLAILHDPNLAALHADRVALLVDGCLTAQGSPGEVLTVAALRQAFALDVLVQRHPNTDRPLVVPV